MYITFNKIQILIQGLIMLSFHITSGNIFRIVIKGIYIFIGNFAGSHLPTLFHVETSYYGVSTEITPNDVIVMYP